MLLSQRPIHAFESTSHQPGRSYKQIIISQGKLSLTVQYHKPLKRIGGMKLNEQGRQKLERQHSWQQPKHANLDSDLLQALKKEPLIALGYLLKAP